MATPLDMNMALGVRIRIADATMVPKLIVIMKMKELKTLNAEMKELDEPGTDRT